MQAHKPLLTTEIMLTRNRDYGLNTLAPVVTMMMSGVYATAAVALADILRTPDERWVRLSMWLYLSIFATLATTRYLHYNALVTRPAPFQLPFQLSVGFVVASCFACLPLSMGGPDGWLQAMNLNILIAPMGVILNRNLTRWVSVENLSDDLQPLVKSRIADLAEAIRPSQFATVLFLGLTVFAWVTRGTPGPWNEILTGVNLAFCALGIRVIIRDARSFQRFQEGIDNLRPAQETAAR